MPEDEILCEISDVLLSFTNPTDYLEIEKGYGRTLVLNKAYIVGINIEEADE
ncbi:TPA: hypothetical protein KB391_004641 [Escherichia coli]|nr:hypothetical protein [Escherichia coli]